MRMDELHHPISEENYRIVKQQMNSKAYNSLQLKS